MIRFFDRIDRSFFFFLREPFSKLKVSMKQALPLSEEESLKRKNILSNKRKYRKVLFANQMIFLFQQGPYIRRFRCCHTRNKYHYRKDQRRHRKSFGCLRKVHPRFERLCAYSIILPFLDSW